MVVDETLGRVNAGESKRIANRTTQPAPRKRWRTWIRTTRRRKYSAAGRRNARAARLMRSWTRASGTCRARSGIDCPTTDLIDDLDYYVHGADRR